MWEIFTAGNRKKLAVGKSEHEAKPNYSTQPFAREIFVTIIIC